MSRQIVRATVLLGAIASLGGGARELHPAVAEFHSPAPVHASSPSSNPSPQLFSDSRIGFPTSLAAFKADLLTGVEDPSIPYTIEPVAQANGYIMVFWTLDEWGGMAIAHQGSDGLWQVDCSGGGAFELEDIEEFCAMAPTEARALYDAWNRSPDFPGDIATVIDPPSNVRRTPNGEILCVVQESTDIITYGEAEGWFYTYVCGQEGRIHHTQVRL